MTGEAEDIPGRKPSGLPAPHEVERALGDGLRQAYREAIDEEIPPYLRELLDRLG